MKLWDKETEKEFFNYYLERDDVSLDNLFYKTSKGEYLAYWPKNYKGVKTTIQGRNAYVGNFMENWVAELIQEAIKNKKRGNEELFVVKGAVCEEIQLTEKSPADVAIATKDVSAKKRKLLAPESIVMIFEVKMSIVWNWRYDPLTKELTCTGDFNTHSGNPGLLRSDSMLKAIGKSINIRVSSLKASRIPIFIIGNTPINESYYAIVDHLKLAGVIQGFISVNPDSGSSLKSTPQQGFVQVENFEEFKNHISNFIAGDKIYFSSMKSKEEIGKLIELANREGSYEQKAERFLKDLYNIYIT